ncbi:MAG: hypothetical protein JWO25_2206 [Alphaproteobacteria bacterium]|nr:hypothetical protein [Alphaproteobacteria bacterium]
MAPLISRAETLRPLAPRPAFPGFAARSQAQSDWAEDLQFFVTAWLGAFLFVGTLFS